MKEAAGARMGRKVKQIRNPSEAMAEADEVVRKFHGREPRGTIELDEEEEYESELGVLGQLLELSILKDNGKSFVPIRFGKIGADGKPNQKLENMVQVATNIKGRPIYFKGGNQMLDVGQLQKHGLATGLGDNDSKGLVVVGSVMSIVYWADKSHLEGPKYQKKGASYEHEFGERADKGEYGEMPMLVYDIGNELIHLAGGSYEVREEGIWN